MKRTFSEKAILVIAFFILGTFSTIAPIASAGSPASPTLANSTFVGGSGDQIGTSIVTDGGSIYVTGNLQPYSWPSNTALVLKYTPDLSSPVWSRTFDFGTNFHGITVSDDNVFATGENYGLTHDHRGGKEVKTFLAKFNSDNTDGPGSGGSMWTTGGPGDLGALVPSYDGGELFYAVTTSVEGSSTVIYAVGSVEPFGGRFVHGIAKYDASGNFIRVAIEPDTSYSAAANGVTVLNGNIYSAGYAGGNNPILWKHYNNLNQIWRKKDTSLAGWFNGVTVSGNAIYAVGNTYPPGVTGGEDYLIRKYDEAGNLLWSKTSGGSDTDILTGVVGIGSRLFAVGYTKSQSSGGADAVVLEIDPETGNTLSTTLFGGAQDDKANGVATDGTDIYVIGESRSFASPADNVIGQNDVMLLRYTLDSAPIQSTLAVSSITPSTATNTGAVSITELSGTGFVSGAGVNLTKTGSPDINATGVIVVSPTKITCTFDLTGKGTGQWNVVVTNPDGTSATLPGGFTITTSPPHTYNLTGSWDMGGPYGVWGFGNCMALRQSGSQVTGNYTHEQGMVTGTVTGNTFSGVWAEAPTYTGEMDSGKFVVIISSDGNSFSGTLGYGNSSTGYAWNGAKSSAVCPVPPEPPTPTPLSVTVISPAYGTNDGAVSATVTGRGFKPGAVVKFTLTGQPDIVASGVSLTGDSTITCTFDLTGKATGTWDLAVTNPVDGTTSVLSTAFTLTSPDITNTNGTIIVSSTPQDALVYLDGSLKGTGSGTLQDVSPGYHSVRVTKTLYNDYGTDVRVAAGSISYVNAVLTPVSGTIIASSNPADANVYLDGMDKGISPVTIPGVSSGVHTVSFTKKDYMDASRTVTMSAGQTMEITVDLTKTGGGWEDWLNTTTLIIVGIIVLIIAIIGYLLRKKKNRWENY